jgi:CDGSH-type Zn-finger protein/uncharacterized Fe-S cluster protein YjdI
MKAKVHSYKSDDIVVEYDVTRCIHVAECFRALPQVFDPERRPWIDPTLASADAIAEVVKRCPTGALHYRRVEEQEQPPQRNEVRAAADGPLFLHGRLVMHMPGGERIEATRVALCRCGASQNKPYCDNSHVQAGFRDSAIDVPHRLTDGGTEQVAVTVTFAPDGPVLIDGPVAVGGTDPSQSAGIKCALCRCGKSQAKPFCDGSHAQAGGQTA